VAERLKRLVFYNAHVIENVRSVFSYVPASMAGTFQALASPDGTRTLPVEFFRDHLMNNADLAMSRAANALMSPEPLARAGSINRLRRGAASQAPLRRRLGNSVAGGS
jgi:hypothetical protein